MAAEDIWQQGEGMKDASLKVVLLHRSARRSGQKWGNRKHDNLWSVVSEHGLAARALREEEQHRSRPACCWAVVTSAVAGFQMGIS